ncbi:MAG: hypothetical protein AAGF31_04815 [Planctomycetota bacterium]
MNTTINNSELIHARRPVCLAECLIFVVCLSLLILSPAAVVYAAPLTDLAAEQAELARKFDRLEALAKRIAELTEAEDPARAEQLRGAIRKSQELALPERFDTIVSLLEQERLAAASRDQATLASQLEVLLRLMLADPDEARDEAERKRLKALREAIKRLIAVQQELRRATPTDADVARLAARQADLAKKVQELRQTQSDETPSGENPDGDQPAPEGTPQGAQPGDSSGESGKPESAGERASQQLQAARQRMLEAVEELEQSERGKAGEQQTEAQRRLEDAKEEVEQALRQLREEELQRRLTKLATRLRRMLAEQIDILQLTQQTEEDRPNRGRRATKIAAAGLANREDQLALSANRALDLLLEDGQSIAFPEVIEQVRDDMQVVAERLRDTKTAAVTQRLEQDIIESLEEAITSLDKTLMDLEERQKQGQQGAPGGEPGAPPVVDKLAELRMIRAIQSRILRRTTFWDEMREAGEVEVADAQEALNRLAARQSKLIRAMKNVGKSPAR